MADKEKVQKKETAYLTIEELAKTEQLSSAVFEGTKALKGWKRGKMVTKEEWQQAVDEFNNAEIRE